MNVVLTVAAIVLAALAVSLAVAIPTGKHLHRAGHRQGLVDPLDCPPWCAKEQAAALTGRAARGAAHRADKRHAPRREL